MSTATLSVAGPIGVRHRAFWRFVWKEYRMLRGFWLAVAALAVMIQLIALATLTRSAFQAEMLFSVALGATVLYAVGAAATLFAVEHEEETYDLLTTIPVDWRPVFFAKLFVATVSSLALLVVLVACSQAMGGIWDRDTVYLLLPALVEVIAWGIFMSLTIRRPLVAAVATIAVVSAQANLVMGAMADHGVAILQVEDYAPAVSWRLAIAAVVLLIDVALGREWLRAPKSKRTPREQSPVSAALAAEVQASFAPRVSALRMMSRLLWQTWRESRLTMLFMAAFAAGAGAIGAVLYYAAEGGFVGARYKFATLFSFATILSALYASAVFGSDQRGRKFYFLAERCARPGIVWLCRQLVWAGSILALVILVACIAATYSAAQFQHWAQSEVQQSLEWGRTYNWSFQSWLFNWLPKLQSTINSTKLILLGIAAGYSVGQFCSILFRRSLIAGFASLLAGAVITLWGLVLWVWNVPGGWMFAFMPILVGLLLASWLRVREWIVERHSIRGWAMILAAIVLPTIAGLYYVREMRVAEVRDWWIAMHSVSGPVIDNRIDPASISSAEELIKIAEAIVKPPMPEGRSTDPDSGAKVLDAEQYAAWRREYISQNQSTIDEAIELSNARVLSFPDRSPRAYYSERLRALAALITTAGNAYTLEGELDRALTAYLASLRILGHARRDASSRSLGEEEGVLFRLRDWSTREGQTKKRLLDAIEQLDLIIPTTVDQWSQVWTGVGYLPQKPSNRADYEELRVAVDDYLVGNSANKSSLKFLAGLANELPFERERAHLVLSHIQRSEWQSGGIELQSMMNDELGAAAKLRKEIKAAGERRWARQRLGMHDLLPEPWSWLNTTHYLENEYDLQTNFAQYLMDVANLYTAQRATKLQLALMAYRIDHNKYPADLEELVPHYLAAVPIDPYFDSPFHYEPNGLPGTLEFDYNKKLPPNTPFFWSVGHENARLDGHTTTVPPEDENQDDPAMWKKRWVYGFDGGTELVFPLPRIEASGAATKGAE